MSCLLAEAAASPLHDATFAASIVPVALVGAVIAAIAFFVPGKTESADATPRTGLVAWLIYVAFALSVVVLAATSFGTILRVGHMGGYALAAHTAGAGAFVFLLLPLTWYYLPGAPGTRRRAANLIQSVTAWLVVLSGLVVAGTMFASMLPILGTNDLLEAVRWHRWAGLWVVVSLLVHAATLLARRRSESVTQASEPSS